MKRVLLFFVLVAALPFEKPASVASAQDLTGLEIIQRNDDQRSAPREYTKMTMRLVDKKGRERLRKVVQYEKIGKDGDKRILIRFLAPADIKGTGLLTLEHKKGEDDQWLYLPAMRKVRRISPANKSDRFVGTDFTYQDLKSEEMSRYDYALAGKDTVRDELCYRVEAVPKDAKERRRSAYSKRVLWISARHFVLVKAFFYDKRGERFKTLQAYEIRRVEGSEKWRARRLEMRNLKTKHSTILNIEKIEIGRRIPENTFTVRTLRRGR